MYRTHLLLMAVLGAAAILTGCEDESHIRSAHDRTVATQTNSCASPSAPTAHRPSAAPNANSRPCPTDSAGYHYLLSKEPDLVDKAVNAGAFTTLTTALEQAGLVETLRGDGPFTVFAPTDEAFAQLPAGTLEALLRDKDALAKVLLYHVVPGRLSAGEVVQQPHWTTAQGAGLPIRSTHGRVMVGEARVLQANVLASNGVIHVIDRVLIPPK